MKSYYRTSANGLTNSTTCSDNPENLTVSDVPIY